MNILSIIDPTTISLTVTTLTCCEMRRVLISLREVMGKPSFSFSIFSFLSATVSPVFLSRARYTTPNVPSAIRFKHWKKKRVSLQYFTFQVFLKENL